MVLSSYGAISYGTTIVWCHIIWHYHLMVPYHMALPSYGAISYGTTILWCHIIWYCHLIYRLSWHDSCIALVSIPRHSYRTLPYIVLHPSDIISHSLRTCDMMSEGCDTSVSDSIRVWYKNHVMMFYLSLNCSIAVLAQRAFITTTQYSVLKNIFSKTVFGWCNFDNTTFYIK